MCPVYRTPRTGRNHLRSSSALDYHRFTMRDLNLIEPCPGIRAVPRRQPERLGEVP